MRRPASFVALVFLAIFAASTVVHAANATLSVMMALADCSAMDMAGCHACDSGADENGDGLACDAVCLAPLAASLGSDGALPINTGQSLTRDDIADLVGRTGPPEPFPPRTLV